MAKIIFFYNIVRFLSNFESKANLIHDLLLLIKQRFLVENLERHKKNFLSLVSFLSPIYLSEYIGIYTHKKRLSISPFTAENNIHGSHGKLTLFSENNNK